MMPSKLESASDTRRALPRAAGMPYFAWPNARDRESHRQFQKVVNNLVERLKPECGVERFSIEDLAVCLCRLRWAWAAELDILNRIRENLPDAASDLGSILAAIDSLTAAGQHLRLIQSYQASLQSDYKRTFRNLKLLKKWKSLSGAVPTSGVNLI